MEPCYQEPLWAQELQHFCKSEILILRSCGNLNAQCAENHYTICAGAVFLLLIVHGSTRSLIGKRTIPWNALVHTLPFPTQSLAQTNRCAACGTSQASIQILNTVVGAGSATHKEFVDTMDIALVSAGQCLPVESYQRKQLTRYLLILSSCS